MSMRFISIYFLFFEVGGQAVLGRQNILPTPWLTERHGYDPTSGDVITVGGVGIQSDHTLTIRGHGRDSEYCCDEYAFHFYLLSVFWGIFLLLNFFLLGPAYLSV